VICRTLGASFFLLPVMWVGATAAQLHRPVFLPPPVIAPAPSPAPLAPPINPGAAPAPAPSLSPILTQPGPLLTIPERAAPSYPETQYPGPVDQQKLRAYRKGLEQEQRRRDRAGVSPATERSREIQQQLNQPGE
jgi:hypothetical protein